MAIYPGSFDPPTVGHTDIIHRAAQIFDKLIVVCMYNPRKKDPMFSPEERVDMLRRVTRDCPNVTVDCSETLLAEYAKSVGERVIVKGLRAMTDFESEFQMSLINRKLNPELDTMFLASGEQYMYLSSGAIKQIGSFGGDISEFVPPEILADVTQRLKNKGVTK